MKAMEGSSPGMPSKFDKRKRASTGRKVSFGLSKSKVHTFNESDIVETVHIISNIPEKVEKAHFILSFAHETPPPPPIQDMKPLKDAKKFDSDDEFKPAAPPPLPTLPDAVVSKDNNLRCMFEMPTAHELPERIECRYTVDDTWSTSFPAYAEALTGPIFAFNVNFDQDSDLLKAIENELFLENDVLPTYHDLKPLRWRGAVFFKVPSLNLDWSISASVTRVVVQDPSRTTKSSIYEQSEIFATVGGEQPPMENQFAALMPGLMPEPTPEPVITSPNLGGPKTLVSAMRKLSVDSQSRPTGIISPPPSQVTPASAPIPEKNDKEAKVTESVPLPVTEEKKPEPTPLVQVADPVGSEDDLSGSSLASSSLFYMYSFSSSSSGSKKRY